MDECASLVMPRRCRRPIPPHPTRASLTRSGTAASPMAKRGPSRRIGRGSFVQYGPRDAVISDGAPPPHPAGGPSRELGAHVGLVLVQLVPEPGATGRR